MLSILRYIFRFVFAFGLSTTIPPISNANNWGLIFISTDIKSYEQEYYNLSLVNNYISCQHKVLKLGTAYRRSWNFVQKIQTSYEKLLHTSDVFVIFSKSNESFDTVEATMVYQTMYSNLNLTICSTSWLFITGQAVIQHTYNLYYQLTQNIQRVVYILHIYITPIIIFYI